MTTNASQEDQSFLCPNCGADVAPNAEFCRECGASDESGWNDEVEEPTQGYDEDDDFDYDEFVRREFPQHAPAHKEIPLSRRLYLALILILCLSILAVSIVGF